jgi:drug/metabolite transporter (DMT)-like permease
MDRHERFDDEDGVGLREGDSLLRKLPVRKDDRQDEEEEGKKSNAAPAASIVKNKHRRGHSEFSFFRRSTDSSSRGHRRRASSRIFDSLENIVEDAQATVHDIRDAWVEEMQDADQGRTTFLETTVMRNLSILPDDLGVLYEELPGGLLDEEDEEAETPTFSIMTYLSLLAAVLAISSNSTALSLQVGVTPALKLFWRMTAVSLVLVGFAGRAFWKEGFPKLSNGQWTTLICAVTCYVTQNLCFMTALNYTSIGNTVLFANTQAVLLLAGKALTGTQLVWEEIVGATIAFGGAVLCATDEGRDVAKTGEDAQLAMFGDVLAMASALLGVGYLTFAKAVRPATSVVAFMFMMMTSGSFLVLGYMAVTGERFSFSTHRNHGLFGWMLIEDLDRFWVEVWIVVVCSLIGTMGFVRSMQYFDSIIIAVATLLEPMIASIIAYIMHVGVLPGPQGWVGNVLVILGTFAVVYPAATKGESSGH